MFREKHILIVEDNVFLAMDLAIAVEDNGGTVVGPVATVADALALVDIQPLNGAVLDCQLTDRDVTPLALRLRALAIPFVINSGTGLPAALAAAVPGLPILVKPVCSLRVLECLAEQIALGAPRAASA